LGADLSLGDFALLALNVHVDRPPRERRLEPTLDVVRELPAPGGEGSWMDQQQQRNHYVYQH